MSFLKRCYPLGVAFPYLFPTGDSRLLSRTERFLLLAFIVIAAVTIRVPRLYSEWPFEFVREVQLTSALAARNLWLTHYKKDLTSEEKIWKERRMGRFVEPPVLPHLVAASYALAGKEIPWVSSLFTALFWLVGAFFVFRIASHTLDEEVGALAATGFFLFTPYAILLSMSFQPEALMVLGYLITIQALLNKPMERGWKSTIQATALAGLCALAKAGASLIPIYTTFWAISFSWKSRYTFFLDRKNLFFILLTPVPSAAYLYWQVGGDKLSNFSSSGDSFLGSLLSLKLIDQIQLLPTIPLYIAVVVGFGAFGFSLLSILLWAPEKLKRVYGGLLLGYLVSILVFFKALGNLKTYNLFAGYYHWPLIVPTALGVGCGVSYLFRAIRWPALPKKSRAGILAMAVTALLALGAPSLSLLEKPAVPDTTLYQVIASAVPKASRVVAITPYLAQDARYYDWLVTQNWLQQMTFHQLMLEGKTVELELKIRMVAEKTSARYLILTIMDRDGVTSQLAKRFSNLPKVLKTPKVVIYDVRSWIPNPDIIRTAKDYLTQAEI